MSNSGLTTLFLMLLFSTASSAHAQMAAPGFDPAPLEIKPVTKTVPRPITSLDLLTIRDITGIQISPDGESVAYVISQAILDSNSYRTSLFVIGTNPGSVPINLGSAGPPQWNPSGQYMKSDPQWSPDSKYITYLMGEKGKRQVWRWSREDGKPEQLTHSFEDVESYEWQPDGKRIIVTTVEPITSEEIKRVSEQGILYDNNTGGDFFSSIRAWEGRPIARAAIETKPRKRQRWVYDFVTQTERRLTPDEDSQYTKLNQPIKIIPGEKSYVVRTKPSPDGKLIAYVTLLYDPSKSSKSRLTIIIKDPDGRRSYELVPPSIGGVRSVWWSKKGDEVYFTSEIEDKGYSLYVVPVRGGPPREVVKSNKEMLSSYSFDEGMSRVAFLRESLTTLPEVAMLNIRDGVARTLVNVNPEFQNIELSPGTKFEWTNKYGDHTFGYLIKPLNYEAGKRYPLIVTTYLARGFLRGNVGDEYPEQVFAANGFAVLCLDLYDADVRIPTPGDFKTLMLRWYSPMASLEQATKTLEDMGIIDPQRKGLTGLSYGSEITNFTITHSDLFQAAVASSGTARDPIIYYLANSYWHKTFVLWGLSVPDGKAAERWRELSPALNAERVKAPLLIQVADSEYIYGLQFYTTMKDLGKPLELIIYADEGHVKNQPKHRYEIYQRNVDWFNFWLQDKEDPDPAKREQYARWRVLREAVKSN